MVCSASLPLNSVLASFPAPFARSASAWFLPFPSCGTHCRRQSPYATQLFDRLSVNISIRHARIILARHSLCRAVVCSSAEARAFVSQDICIGEFFDTPERRMITEFSGLLQLKSVVLVGMASAEKMDFGRLLRPFTKGTIRPITLLPFYMLTHDEYVLPAGSLPHKRPSTLTTLNARFCDARRALDRNRCCRVRLCCAPLAILLQKGDQRFLPGVLRGEALWSQSPHLCSVFARSISCHRPLAADQLCLLVGF